MKFLLEWTSNPEGEGDINQHSKTKEGRYEITASYLNEGERTLTNYGNAKAVLTYTEKDTPIDRRIFYGETLGQVIKDAKETADGHLNMLERESLIATILEFFGYQRIAFDEDFKRWQAIDVNPEAINRLVITLLHSMTKDQLDNFLALNMG